MTSAKFKFVDRGFKETIVLIPGWATDCRIFDSLDLYFNYILPVGYFIGGFKESLFNFVRERSLSKISLFGWSLGTFLAADFSSKYSDMVDELILISICRKYAPKTLKMMRQRLAQDVKAALYKFYLSCFSANDTESLVWFRKNLLKDYLCEQNLENLMPGLDYLSLASMDDFRLFKIKNIRIFHGQADGIAPLDGAISILDRMTNAELFVLPGVGHIPFLSSKFRNKFMYRNVT